MSRPNRSVNDFGTEEELRKAILSNSVRRGASGQPEGQPPSKVARKHSKEEEDDEPLDWVLPSFDPETTEPQSMSEELKRLQVLKSYLILDSQREEAFDRITALAARMFDVPIALVSLIDLGRQWFMSHYGVDASETPRKHAFCAHAILNKHNILVVRDATLDFRFRENPLVTGSPHIRFYVGAALISPEGFKLGTLCIIDSVPRPNGLSEDESAMLHDLADITVKVMVDRRFQKQPRVDPAKLIAYTAHDLMTPLTGVQLSLSLLKDDDQLKERLSDHQLELINTAASSSDLMIRMCARALEGLHQYQAGADDAMATELTDSTESLTKIEELVKSLNMILEPIPKTVPCIIKVDKQVPSVVAADDLKLFRSTLNLLTDALNRTTTGYVRLSIRRVQNDQLMFECEDTGEEIPVAEYPHLFELTDDNSRIGLSSMAVQVASLNGQYGCRPRGIAPDGSVVNDSKGERQTGSIFWFSIPLKVPESVEVGVDAGVIERNYGTEVALSRSVQGCCQETIVNFASALSFREIDEKKLPAEPAGAASDLALTRRRRALIIDDSLVLRKTLGHAYKRLGFDVSHAADGMEGLRQLKESIFDITLCDFLMPNMDGIDCVQQYRVWEKENRPWFQQLIIGISAHADEKDRLRGLQVGMDDFKPKPITLRTLTELQETDAAISRAEQLDNLVGDSELKPVPATGSDQAPTENICLIATDKPTTHSNQVVDKLEEIGWKVVAVHDGKHCLRLLQMRNWGAVLIDDDLPELRGADCVSMFRIWEKDNRVNGQTNVFLVSEGEIPSPTDKSSLVQPPHGCNGVLRKPVPWEDLQTLLDQRDVGAMNIVIRDKSAE